MNELLDVIMELCIIIIISTLLCGNLRKYFIFKKNYGFNIKSLLFLLVENISLLIIIGVDVSFIINQYIN